MQKADKYSLIFYQIIKEYLIVDYRLKFWRIYANLR